MTNPDNAVGTNAGYNGRTSTRAFNDDLGPFSRGVVSGWTCAPKTGMTVELGGNGSERDVAIAEDNAGNRTTINNTSGAPVPITLDASPASGSRYDLIVAYVENPAQGSGSTDVDFTTQVGFIAVKGTASSSPVVPNETAIRTAITSDGATGASAYYVILAQIRVGTNVSSIGSGVITQGTKSQITLPAGAGTISTSALASSAVTAAKIDWSTMPMYSSTTTSGSDYKCSVSPTVAGKYLVIGTGRVQRSNSTWMYAYLKRIRSGAETKIIEDQSMGQVVRCTFSAVGIIDVQAGDTIRINFNTEDGTTGMTVTGVSLKAIYIHS